jgi:methyltransferase (TIGR00027 family)
MEKGGASQTAIGPAIMRAAHQVIDSNPKILSDPITVGLLDGASEDQIRTLEANLQQPIAKVMRSGFVLRSRFAEDRLSEAFKTRTRQYIILGAGLDTFAYRQPEWAAALRIFEVDHPASQDFKRDLLAKAGISIPPNVEFCPIDFEHTTLKEGLAASSLDPELPAFLSWLGVTQYLTQDAIEATLRFVPSLAGGSQIVFTFALPDESVEGDDLLVAQAAAAMGASIGEPWLTRFEAEPLRAWLLELGYSDVFHLTPKLASERYFAGRSDGLRAPVLEQLMCASV